MDTTHQQHADQNRGRFAIRHESTVQNDQYPTITLIGRVLLSLIFLLTGFQKLFAWGAVSSAMEAEGMVAVPLFLLLAIAFELLGGLSILTGTYARVGAAALVAYLIPVTLLFHDFWTYEGELRQLQTGNFLKNLAIMGGLLTLTSRGAGRLSTDAKLDRGEGSSYSRAM